MLPIGCPGCEERFSTYEELAIHCGNQRANVDASFVQTTGAGPKPSNIQPPFKTVCLISHRNMDGNKLCKKEGEAVFSRRTDGHTTQQILQLDHVFLQTCFLYGRRDPPEDGENIV
ncbi:unnamed protein product [Cylicostephanus goldi]|uniref:Uncharacterized protein n=1 Tax=Cylicostephanus goldi TaxID=71465 RepID=A0A3P6SGA1_CYLGO|nr:unnamed protein product [Cylicostephanus goldi]